MENGEFKAVARLLLLVITFFSISYCASIPDLIGKWKEVGKTAMIEFWEDGAFKAVDNQGMAVSGKYTLSQDGYLQCEIQQEGRAAEVVKLKVSIKGDELTLILPGGK